MPCPEKPIKSLDFNFGGYRPEKAVKATDMQEVTIDLSQTWLLFYKTGNACCQNLTEMGTGDADFASNCMRKERYLDEISLN